MPSDQHVVIEGGEVLRYPSLASANAIYMDKSVLFTSAQDFEDRYSMAQMQALGKTILKNKFNSKTVPKSKPLRAEWIWQTCIRYARPHNPNAKRGGKRAEKRADTRYRVSPLYLEDSHIAFTPVAPQVRAMIGYFVSYMSPDGVDEEGVEILIRNMHDEGLLVTRQDPVRIWRYYRAEMLNKCFLEEI